MSLITPNPLLLDFCGCHGKMPVRLGSPNRIVRICWESLIRLSCNSHLWEIFEQVPGKMSKWATFRASIDKSADWCYGGKVVSPCCSGNRQNMMVDTIGEGCCQAEKDPRFLLGFFGPKDTGRSSKMSGGLWGKSSVVGEIQREPPPSSISSRLACKRLGIPRRSWPLVADPSGCGEESLSAWVAASATHGR